MKNWIILSLQSVSLKSKGFTLVELIIVIAILSILATTLIMTLNPSDQFAKAADAKRKVELAQIQRGLEQYYQDHNGFYPLSDSSYRIVDSQLGSLAWGSAWGSYMSILPKDVAGGKKYAYYSYDGKEYFLYASLDRNKDPEVCIQPSQSNPKPECVGASALGAPYTACGNQNACNYGVSSPNVTP